MSTTDRPLPPVLQTSASRPALIVTVTDLDSGEPEWTGDLDEFITSNIDTLDEVDCADLAFLEIDQALRFGGGAAPLVEVRRVS